MDLRDVDLRDRPLRCPRLADRVCCTQIAAICGDAQLVGWYVPESIRFTFGRPVADYNSIQRTTSSLTESASHSFASVSSGSYVLPLVLHHSATALTHCIQLGTDDLLAAFVAGTAFSWDDRQRELHEDENVHDIIDTLVNAAVFVYMYALCLCTCTNVHILRWMLIDFRPQWCYHAFRYLRYPRSSHRWRPPRRSSGLHPCLPSHAVDQSTTLVDPCAQELAAWCLRGMVGHARVVFKSATDTSLLRFGPMGVSAIFFVSVCSVFCITVRCDD
jgi:hypothetical protein